MEWNGIKTKRKKTELKNGIEENLRTDPKVKYYLFVVNEDNKIFRDLI